MGEASLDHHTIGINKDNRSAQGRVREDPCETSDATFHPETLVYKNSGHRFDVGRSTGQRADRGPAGGRQL